MKRVILTVTAQWTLAAVLFLVLVFRAGDSAPAYAGPEYGQAALPSVVIGERRLTIPAYRARIDKYIDVDYGYYPICVSHMFHLWDIERNLDTRFDTQEERDNALVVIGLYEQACRERSEGACWIPGCTYSSSGERKGSR